MRFINRRYLLALVAVCALSSVAVAQKKAGKWEEMDYGSFITASISANTPKRNTANKGIAVKLGTDQNAAVCFDMDLLRYSCGWSGDYLDLKGTPFDGGHGNWPQVKGKPLWQTPQGPGWARPGSDDFKDPRREAFGPVPSEWARYRGLYRHGDKVVFTYTVGNTTVLELPSAEVKDGVLAFTRTFNIGASKTSQLLLICEVEGAKAEVADGIGTLPNTLVGLVNAPKGAVLEASGAQIRLKLPASTEAASFRVVIGATKEAGKFKAFLGKPSDSLDLAPLTKGGPASWTKPVTTKGTLGTEKGAYVSDTLTVPYDNPYKSWMRFGGFDFFNNGNAALCTWSGDIWTVSGIDEKLEKLEWKRFAAGLFQPLGLKIVDDKVYALGREGIMRLTDLNNDGEADFYEAFNIDVHTTTGFHEFPFDLHTDPDGNFYFAKAGPVRGGGRGFEYIADHSGCILKVSKDGSKIEVYASGFRAPNGIGVGPKGEVTSGDNEGTWMPMCRLSLVRQGGFCGCVDTYHGEKKPTDYDPPICWLPKNVDNSNGGQTWVTSDKWGPLKGQLLHTSYGTSSLYLAPFEKDGDLVQGGVVKFPVKFVSGVMRPRFSKIDGQLYIAGLRGWQSNAATDACFHRVRYMGAPAKMLCGIKVTKTGLDLTFTDPLDAKVAGNADNYSASQWNYLWCSEYGSDTYSAKDPEFHKKVLKYNELRAEVKKNTEAIAALAKEFKKGKDSVAIKSAKLSADGKTVSLEIPDLHTVMQFNLKFKLKAADGSAISSDEMYSTINWIPR